MMLTRSMPMRLMCLCLLITVQFFQKRCCPCCVSVIHHAKLPFHTVWTAVLGPHAGRPFVGTLLFIGKASSAQHLGSLGISNLLPDASADFMFSRKSSPDRQGGEQKRAQDMESDRRVLLTRFCHVRPGA